MLVPNRILGGILATALGLHPGLAAFAEPSVPPTSSLSITLPAPLTTASLQPADEAPFLSLRPVARPDGIAVRAAAPPLRPMARDDLIPVALWDRNGGNALWSRATLAAINSQTHDLSDLVPRDIATWCPAYPRNPERLRDAFWVGVISALVRHESRFDPQAVGGGGLYHGLLQILPATARHHGCAATTGQALLDPASNLACGVEIMAETVRRDGAIAVHEGRWLGIASDWGPMTNSDKRAAMAGWTREQTYCTLPTGVTVAPRPPARPWPAPIPDAVRVAMLSIDPRALSAIP